MSSHPPPFPPTPAPISFFSHPFLPAVLLWCLTEKRRRQICSLQPPLATNEFRLHPNELLAELLLHSDQRGEREKKKSHAKARSLEFKYGTAGQNAKKKKKWFKHPSSSEFPSICLFYMAVLPRREWRNRDVPALITTERVVLYGGLMSHNETRFLPDITVLLPLKLKLISYCEITRMNYSQFHFPKCCVCNQRT